MLAGCLVDQGKRTLSNLSPHPQKLPEEPESVTLRALEEGRHPCPQQLLRSSSLPSLVCNHYPLPYTTANHKSAAPSLSNPPQDHALRVQLRKEMRPGRAQEPQGPGPALSSLSQELWTHGPNSDPMALRLPPSQGAA